MSWEVPTAIAIMATFALGPAAGLKLLFRWPARRILHNLGCNRAWAWPHNAECAKCDAEGWPSDPD